MTPQKKSLLRTRSILIALAFVLVLGLSPQTIRPVFAAGLGVSVGYADDLRASPFFPNPWCGGLNVALCNGNNALGSGVDSGAIKLDNPTGSDIVVDSVVVQFPNHPGAPSSINLWGSFTVPAGKSVILDQTAQFNFDTSDFPITGCGTIDTNAANDPTVTITIGGVPTTYTDVGRVLDTGGYDFACQGNESLQWRPITSTCGVTCPGGAGVPEFGLPAIAVVAAGFLAIVLMRKSIIARSSRVPSRSLAPACNRAR